MRVNRKSNNNSRVRTMAPPLPDTAKLLTDNGLSPAEIARRKEFLEFRDPDAARLAALAPLAKKYADEVIDELYSHLLSFKESREFFPDQGTLERVKRLQKDYFLRLTSGRYDEEYIANRLLVGAVHERTGVAVKLYLGGYRRYLDSVVRRLLDGGGVKQPYESIRSLLKLVFLDVGLTIDKYIFERERTIRVQNEELVEQYRQVQNVSRLKSEFLANMSHELRTPLNAIIGFSELLHDGRAGDVTAKQKSYIGDVLSSARHLLQLINDVLDLSKVESGKMEFFPELIDPSRLVNEVRDIFRTLTANKRITLRIAIDPHLGEVVLDPAKLKQVLFNYLSNALKFTPEQGSVVVRMRAAGETDLRLEVEDSGIGIRPQDEPRLFVEFQQLDASASKKYQGTGLGLALTKRIVVAQGGHVGVISRPGRGSLFFAQLPRVHASVPGGAADRVHARNSAPTTSHPAVLVIEKDLDERQWLTSTLIDDGYQVQTAATGAEALQLLRERRFNAVTLNLNLPDMSGWEILRHTRGGLNRDVPVIVVSILAEKGGGVGFSIHDFLEKPVSEQALLAKLERPATAAARGKKILLVDDNRKDLKLLRAVLSHQGYTTIAKTSALAALRAVAEKPPDCVVLDLVMPRVDGFEFLRRLRAMPAGANIPVIVLTAKHLLKAEVDRLRAMSQAVVSKGDGATRTLLAEMSTALAQRRSLRSTAAAVANSIS